MQRSQPTHAMLGLVTVAALAGCARMPPADVTATATSRPDSSQAFVEATPAGPCTTSAFDACTEVCSTRECLDWCGGPGCVAVATNLNACAAPAEAKFEATHPEPAIELLPPGPDAPEGVEPEINPASEERRIEWDIAREEALDEHWRSSCRGLCEGAFIEASPEDVALACEEAGARVWGWAAFAKPEPKPEPDSRMTQAQARELAASSGILGAMASDSSMLVGWGSLGGGSYLTVDRESLQDFAHRSALSELITRGSDMSGAEGCVGSLDDDGEDFAFVMEFDAQGRLQLLHQDSSGAASECVADMLQSQVRLPAPAARGLPAEIRLTVHVREEVPLDTWGGLMGDDIGEAYGVGGLGMSGSGLGGGGSGTGTGSIGIGTIGSGGGGASGYGSGSGGGGSGDGSKDDAD